MTELEDRLRNMMRDRAGDIDTVPDRLLGIGVERPLAPPTDIAVGRHRPGRGGRSRAWLLSAAAVAVIALGLAALLAVRDGSGTDRDPVGTQRPSAPASTSPAATSAATSAASSAATSPAPVGPRTAVSLDWFATDRVADFTVVQRSSEPGYRDLSWIRKGERDTPPDSNGGLPRSATVTVFAAGRFPAAQSGILRVAASPGQNRRYSADARRVTGGELDTTRVPTIAWTYAPDAWVVVQAVTTTVTSAELRQLADAVRPTTAVPITLPFRLASPPPGRIDQIVDGRPDFAMIITFREGDTKTTEFQLRSTAEGAPGPAGVSRRLVGGLVGYVDFTSGAFIGYADGSLSVRKAEGDTPDNPGLNLLLDGLTWSGRNGNGPAIPLRAAIGR